MPRWMLVWLALAACAAPPPAVAPEPLPTSPAGVDRATIAHEVDTLLALSDRACECKDRDCLTALDRDLRAYAAVATINDPVTGLETWPSDLDALGRAANDRINACFAEHDMQSTRDAVFRIRRFEGLRDAGCSCTDADCAGRVKVAYDRYLEKVHGSNIVLTPDELDRISATAREAQVCIATPMTAQAIRELTEIRDAACECEDVACADEQRAAVEAWSKRHEHTRTDRQESYDKLVALGQEVWQCIGEVGD
jgi:hypothetical protein